MRSNRIWKRLFRSKELLIGKLWKECLKLASRRIKGLWSHWRRNSLLWIGSRCPSFISLESATCVLECTPTSLEPSSLSTLLMSSTWLPEMKIRYLTTLHSSPCLLMPPLLSPAHNLTGSTRCSAGKRHFSLELLSALPAKSSLHSCSLAPVGSSTSWPFSWVYIDLLRCLSISGPGNWNQPDIRCGGQQG